MRILLLGSGYFKPWLAKAGAEVAAAGPDPDCELRADPSEVDLSRLAAGMKPGPDLVLLTDDLGRRVLPWGLERCGLPKVYYGVDAPLNLFWQVHLAHLFDLVALDQKEEAEKLSARTGREVLWLPVGVDPSLYEGPPEEEVHDLAFVGTVEERVRPRRSNILRLLKERFRVETAGARGQGWLGPGEAARLYRRAGLVLNENLFPGVTTRMLEVMAAGGCLFTEEAGNGLTDLFRPGVHYVPYGPPGGPGEIISQAEHYLNRPEKRKAIAWAGQAECLAKHTIFARAQRLLAAMEEVLAQKEDRPQGSPKAREMGELAWATLLTGLRWPERGGERRLARALLLFKEARRQGATKAGLGLALGLIVLGRSPEAEEVLDRELARGEAGHRALLALGMIKLQAGQEGRAKELLARAALSIDPEQKLGPYDQEVLRDRAEFHLVWGRLLDLAGEGLCPGFNLTGLPTALWWGVEHLSRAVDLAPDRIEPLVCLAELLDRHGQAALSFKIWSKAAGLAPDEERVRLGLEKAGRAGYVGS